MNRFLIIFLLIGLVSCETEKKEPSGPVIAVSVVPQVYLVKSIIDTLADVVVMVPPGASPATWEATPSDMKSLGDALVYLRIGHIGFEQAWISNIMDINPDLRIVDLSANLPLRGIDYKHGDHSHRGVDPHTWMSPANMEVMARRIFGEMEKLFPENKPQLRRNYSKLMVEIKGANNFASRELAGHKGESFLIFHPSLGYYADAYELTQMSIEYEGKEPSPAHMKEVIDQARAAGIKTIFVQKEFDMRNAEIIAEEIGANVVQIDPLSIDWPAEMKRITLSLKSSFDNE
ncbi:MAG: zinc ABC transporter substrate-binding protein [Bacteroidetes bacterium]|nr:MAG: zinc ABC transporter substrate-binding protein [Bacteroidota bacterium]